MWRLPQAAQLCMMAITSHAVLASSISYLSRPVTAVHWWPPLFTGGPFPFPFSAMLLVTLPRFIIGVQQLLLAEYDQESILSLNVLEYFLLAFLDTASLLLLFLAAFNPNLMLDALLMLSFTDIAMSRLLFRKGLHKSLTTDDMILCAILLLLPIGYTFFSISAQPTDISGFTSRSSFSLSRIIPLGLLFFSSFLNILRVLLIKTILRKHATYEENPMEDELEEYILSAGLKNVSNQHWQRSIMDRLIFTPAFELSSAAPTMSDTMKIYFLGSTLLSMPTAVILAFFSGEYPASWSAIQSLDGFTTRTIIGFSTASIALAFHPVFEMLSLRFCTPGQYMMAIRLPFLLGVPAAVIGLDRVTNFTLAQLIALFGIALATGVMHFLGHLCVQNQQQERADKMIEKELGPRFDKLFYNRLLKAAPPDPTGDTQKYLGLEVAVYGGDLVRWYEHRNLRPWWKPRDDVTDS